MTIERQLPDKKVLMQRLNDNGHFPNPHDDVLKRRAAFYERYVDAVAGKMVTAEELVAKWEFLGAIRYQPADAVGIPFMFNGVVSTIAPKELAEEAKSIYRDRFGAISKLVRDGEGNLMY
jgi:hypothetical protein